MTRPALTAALLLCASLCVAQAVTLPPSAKELSQPDSLQAWIDTSLRTDGFVTLPRGDIHSDPLIIDAHGGDLDGVGMATVPHDSRNGHNYIPQGCTRLIANDPSKPLITLRRCQGFTIRDLSIETTGVGIYLQAERGWGNFHNTLERVVFFGCSEAFKAGEKLSDINGADATFTGVLFNRCKVGLAVYHNQGVNWHLNQCSAYHCGDFVLMHGGGSVRLTSPTTYNTARILTIHQGGRNLGRSVIRDGKFDRSKDGPFPVVVNSKARVLVDGADVTYNGEPVPADWRPFVGRVTVRDRELNSLPPVGGTL